MAHLVENMMYNETNGKPWHELGEPVSGLGTAKDVMKHAGLNWEVQKHPLQTEGGIHVPDRFAMVRESDQSVLGTVGDRYQPLQNKDAFEFFDPIVDRDEAIYETAGSLRGGRQVWLLAKMPDHIRVGKGDDTIEKYVMLTNSHDGSKPVVAKITPVRVVCNNTLSWALKGSGSEVRIRHTMSMRSQLQEAHKTLNVVNKIYSQLEETYNAMLGTKVSTDDMDHYFNHVFNNGKDEVASRTENTIDEVKRLLEEGAGVDMPEIRGTLWHAYNAVTEYVDFYKGYRTGTDVTHAVTFGSGASRKENAFKQAVAFMN